MERKDTLHTEEQRIISHILAETMQARKQWIFLIYLKEIIINLEFYIQINFSQTQGKLKIISGFPKIKEFINSVSVLQGMLTELLQAEGK